MGDTVILAIPLTDVQATLDNLLQFEGLISAAVLLALALFAWSIIGVGLRPLERMGSTAKAIAAGDLSRRVEPATPRTEIGRLGLSLNGMLSQIEMAFAERTRSEQRLRRFLADASHELRTPLTSIRGYAELLRRGAAQTAEDSALARRRIEAEAIRMSVMVDDLLLLARLDQGRPLDQAPVDLQQIAHDACADARAVAPSRAITLWAREAVVVRGDELRLRQVVANLVSNAIVHTPTGTPIEVSVTSNGERAALSVTDHGPGLKGEETGRVFEPFYRADPGRSRDRGGSGLGLSIVAAVVTAHGGVVQVLETPGGGATFRVELPRAGARAEIEETPRKPEVRTRSA
jgi:two-component system OmpR family sensor kinase